MQGKVRVQLERSVSEGNSFENVFFLDKKHTLYRRMERWVRLQQFVYGLGDDFSYSVYESESGGISTCRTLVRVGEMNWYGEGKAADRQQALAQALVATTNAISANAYKVFFYSATKWLKKRWKNLHARPSLRIEAVPSRQEHLLAS